MDDSLNKKPSGISGSALRVWGMLFLTLGIVGRGIIRNKLLGLGTISSAQLLELLQSSSDMMVMATVSLVLSAAYTCAVPIFTFLLVEGFCHTGDYRKYLLRVAGLALISELPYNLAMSGKLLDTGSRNPVFGLVIGLIALYFYRRYSEKSWANRGIQVLVTLAAVLWAFMLGIDEGVPLLILIAALWALRSKPIYRNLVGCIAAILCSVLSPFYLASPMAFVALHFYNGEKGESSRTVNYLAYPAILLVVGICAKFLL
ncbi:MAG: hypothetical protein J6L24_02315 [Oscillospiraceae bacterium]|nr:hypothetical protein [Oscillospiraceae bacterium]